MNQNEGRSNGLFIAKMSGSFNVIVNKILKSHKLLECNKNPVLTGKKKRRERGVVSFKSHPI